jgi:hypothetical protein
VVVLYLVRAVVAPMTLEECRELLPTREPIAFGCSAHLFRLERASSLRSPARGRDKRIGAKPGRSLPNRKPAVAYFEATSFAPLRLAGFSDGPP